MTSDADMPQYDGMGYEELVSSAQFLWLENAKLREEIGRWITLPEYPMAEFKPKDTERENAKLRDGIDKYGIVRG